MDKKRLVGDKVLYPELSYQVMNTLFEVHNHLGPGYTEDIYEKALVVELAARQVPFEEQKAIPISYSYYSAYSSHS